MASRILRDKGAAEEILQDIFYQVWRTAEKFDPQRGSLPGWLVVVARNRAISKLRRRSTSGDDELNENTVACPFNLEYGRLAESVAWDACAVAMENLARRPARSDRAGVF